MDFNRDLWADAYRLYQQQVSLMERSREDLPTYFCNLSGEITRRCSQASPEATELWTAVYAMLEKRAKQEERTNAES